MPANGGEQIDSLTLEHTHTTHTHHLCGASVYEKEKPMYGPRHVETYRVICRAPAAEPASTVLYKCITVFCARKRYSNYFAGFLPARRM